MRRATEVGLGAAVIAWLAIGGCAQPVAGTAGPTPSTAAASAPGAEPTPARVTAAGPRSALDSDVVPDECLLDAVRFGALLGRPVLEPENLTIHRSDGSTGTSCYAHAGEGFPTPLAAINVYTVRTGTAAEFVRATPAGGRRDLPGVGDAAALVDTGGGPTLQLASARYLVTIIVLLDRGPSDDAWRAAGQQALARLPR